MGHEHKKNKNQRARKEVSLMYAEKREEEITDQIKNGKPIEEKSDQQLFTISKKATNTTPTQLLSKREKKKELARNKLTKDQKILASNDNVEEISKNKNVSKNILTSDEVILARTINNIENKSKAYTEEYLQDMNIPTPNKKHHIKNEMAGKNKRKTIDLWADDNSNNNGDDNNTTNNTKTKKKVVDQDNYLHINEEEIVHHRPNHIPLVKGAKAVEIPSAGMSYRPSTEDHQNTLRKALEIEKKADRYVKSVEKKFELQEIPTRVLKKLKVDRELEKKRDEKIQKEKEEMPLIKGEDGKFLTIGQLLSINDAKTSKEIKKSKRRAIHQSNIARKKKDNKVIEDIDHIDEIIQELDQTQQINVAKSINRKKIRQEMEKSTKKISNAMADTVTEAFLLPSELPSSLMDIKNPTFHPLKDRMRSLQKRSLVTNHVPNLPSKALFSVVKNYAYDNTRVAEYNDEPTTTTSTKD